MSRLRKSRWMATTEILVPFHDVDMMEIVWHGHYVKYIEIARCALLESIEYDYMQMKESGYGWPVIDIRLRYVRPAQFGNTILVTASLVEWENRLRIAYEIRDKASGERLTKGESVQVAVDMQTMQMQFASPPVVYQKLGLPVPDDA